MNRMDDFQRPRPVPVLDPARLSQMIETALACPQDRPTAHNARPGFWASFPSPWSNAAWRIPALTGGMTAVLALSILALPMTPPVQQKPDVLASASVSDEDYTEFTDLVMLDVLELL